MSERVAPILARLVKARELAGLSQGQVAKMLGLSGTASSVSQWEHGGRGLDMERFLQLCELYRVNEVWVLTGINPSLDANAAYNLAVGIATDSRKLWDILSAVAEAADQ